MAEPGNNSQTLRALWREVGRDIDAYAEHAADLAGRRAGRLRRISSFLTPPLSCAFFYRLSHWLWNRDCHKSAYLLGLINYLLHKADISPAAHIGAGLYIPHTVGIVFHGHAGDDLALFAHAIVCASGARPALSNPGPACPQLGNRVTVGAFSVVTGPVLIGDGVKIGAAAVVIEDIVQGAVGTGAMPMVRRRASAAIAGADSGTVGGGLV